jgi:16S rRNA (guanine966-N2)-methyltransferase
MPLYITSGLLKNRRLILPAKKNYRPTTSYVRDLVLNVIGRERLAGAAFLDVFAGSGAMGFEAISRGAASAHFIENDRTNVAHLLKNIDWLGLGDSCVVLPVSFARAIPILAVEGTPEGGFDCVFIDPPYRSALGQACLEALAVHKCILADDARIFIETHGKSELVVPGAFVQIDERGTSTTRVVQMAPA